MLLGAPVSQPPAGGMLQLGAGVMDLGLGAVGEPRKTPRTPRALDTTADLRPSANSMRPLMLSQGSGLLTSSQLQQLGATAGAGLTAASAAMLSQAGLTPSQLCSLQLGGLGTLGLQGRANSIPTLLLQQPGGLSPLSSGLLPLHGDLSLGQDQEMLKLQVNMACSQRAVEQLETRLVQERQSRNNDRMALNVMLHDMNTQLRTEVLRRQIVEQQLALERKLRNDLLAEIRTAGPAHEELLQSDKIRALLQQLNACGDVAATMAITGAGAGVGAPVVPVLDMAQAVLGGTSGTVALGVKTPRTDSHGSAPAPGGSEGRGGMQDEEEGRQGSSRRKGAKSRSGRPGAAALRNASQEDLCSGGRRKRGSDRSASTTQGAADAADADQAAKAGPSDMGDRWAALCATVDQETQQMQQGKEDQVGGLPLLAMSLGVEEVGPDSCTNSSARGVGAAKGAEGAEAGDNAATKRRRTVTPAGVMVHLGD